MNIVYFVLASVSWGFTWYAIKIHVVSGIPAEQSGGYRYLLASLIIYLFCIIQKMSVTYTWREHLLSAIQGLCLCSLNFSLYCLSMKYIPSGLVSICCATLVFMNVANNRFFFGTPIFLKTILGGCVGFLGIILVFAPYLGSLSSAVSGVWGVILCLIATYIVSVGNTLARYKNNPSKNAFQNVFLVMFYGGIFSLSMSLFQGESLKISFDPEYIGALLYLVVFASIIGFVSYMQLIKTIGSDKAAYAMMVSPIIALVVSSFLEGLSLTWVSMSGVVLIFGGSVVVLSNSERKSNVNAEKAINVEKAA